MKVAVLGGSGLIGSKTVRKLRAEGHEATPHSRSTGVDLISGEGLQDAVNGAEVVVDLTNAPSFDDASPVFFRTSTENLLEACRKGGVGHVVVLSIVGADQVPGLAHYRGKVVQEEILKAGRIPWSIVRATQFMEFVDTIMSWTTEGATVRLPTTPLQPIAADDVATVVAEVAAGTPLNSTPVHGTLDIAGPDVFPLDDLGRLTLDLRPDGRTVVTDDTAGLYAAAHGAVLTVVDESRAIVAPTHYRDWLMGRIEHA